MATKLIELQDGILVEVDVVGGEIEQISGSMADKVQSSLDRVKPILVNTCRPIMAAWKELNKDMLIEQAEIELGLSFEGEGNMYVAKVTAGANLIVKLTLKPKE
jgi:Trypsin-co-occurring domain 1